VAPEPHGEREVAGLEVEQPEQRIGVSSNDRRRVRLGDLLDLDAALGRARPAPCGRSYP